MSLENEEFTYSRFMKKVISFYFNILNFVLKSLKKYWFIPLFIFIGLAIMFYFQYKKTKTIYTATTSYTYNYFNKKYYGDLLLDINKLVRNSETEALAQILKLKNENAENIISFEAVNLLGKPLEEDYSDARIPFYINATCTHKESFKPLQEGITIFLNESDFSVKHIKENNFFLTERLKVINSDLRLLDSLKQNSSINDVDALAKIISVYDSKIEERKNNISLFEKNTAVSLLNPFQIHTTTKENILKKLSIKYFIFFIVSSIFISLLWNWYKSEIDEF